MVILTIINMLVVNKSIYVVTIVKKTSCINQYALMNAQKMWNNNPCSVCPKNIASTGNTGCSEITIMIELHSSQWLAHSRDKRGYGNFWLLLVTSTCVACVCCEYAQLLFQAHSAGSTEEQKVMIIKFMAGPAQHTFDMLLMHSHPTPTVSRNTTQ